MKKNLFYIFSISLIAAMFSLVTVAQDSRVVSAAGDKYVISAKAGGVNYIEGNVSITRKVGKSGYLLKGDTIEIGDIVSTGTEGKAEILLNPGSYIRLAENSQFEFISTSLDDLKLKLSRGSAMLEVIADDEFRVAIKTPKANFYAVKSGVYRIDVMTDGSGKISVWKGEAQIGDGNATEIKKGRAAVVNGNQVAVEKFDRDEKDSLEIWSKERSKELAKINARLKRDNLRTTLLNAYNGGRWNMYGSFGLWVFDPFTGYYCFLPFGYGWSSPYGYDYGRDIWWCRLPRRIYYEPPPPTSAGETTTPPAAPSSDRNAERTRRIYTPPFRRVENSAESRSDSGNDGNTSSSDRPSGRNNDRTERKSDSSDRKYEPPQRSYEPPQRSYEPPQRTFEPPRNETRSTPAAPAAPPSRPSKTDNDN